MSRRSRKKTAPKRPPTSGSFVAGDDDRRDAGSFKAGPDDRRSDGQFKPGFDPRRNAGSKPKSMREFTALLRENVDDKDVAAFLRTQLIDMLKSGHGPTRINAWREWVAWGFGKAPAAAISVDDDDAMPDDAALQRMIELDLKRRALAGDPQAQLLVLRALDPKKYGGEGTPDDDGNVGPPTLNFVGIGEAREGHKPDAG